MAAAAAAFEEWSGKSHEERSKLLARASEALAARTDEIAETISKEVGMPLSLSKIVQVGLPIGVFADMAAKITDFQWETEVGNSLIVREPIGVVGAITPWNYPLYQIALKVAPALAAGCTVVLKPSEVAPLNAFVLADVLHDVGFPPGVFNLVTGIGNVVGEAIAAHPKVDMVSFTGSTRAGKRVMTLAADTVKKVALELGESRRTSSWRTPISTPPSRPVVRLLHELGADLLRADQDAGPAVAVCRGRGEGEDGCRGVRPG